MAREMKLLEKLLFAQGKKCFFCEQPLEKADASVEHVVARANGGGNGEDNCVACCKDLNEIFGSKSLKAKLRIILNQKGDFRCPGADRAASAPKPAKAKAAIPSAGQERLALVVANLQKRKSALPAKVKTLVGTITSMFRATPLAPGEAEKIMQALQDRGFVTVSGTKVSYTLSGG